MVVAGLLIVLWVVSFEWGVRLQVGYKTKAYVACQRGRVAGGVYQSWWHYRTEISPSWLQIEAGPPSDNGAAIIILDMTVPLSLLEFGIGWRNWEAIGLTTGWDTFHGHAGWAGFRVRISLSYPIVLLGFLGVRNLRRRARERDLPGFPVELRLRDK